MMESRSYYHPDERGSEPEKWCVKLMIAGADHGIIGMDSKKQAQGWLDQMTAAVKEGIIFQGFELEDTTVYYAR